MAEKLKTTTDRRRRRSRLRRAVMATGIFFSMWLGGLYWFTTTLPPGLDVPAGLHVDGIVVLTGSAGRIAAGVTALETGVGDRLLISGVNPSIADKEIRRLIGPDSALFDCCIDLDRQAADTRGNAEQAANWARDQGYRSLLVITARYHMPRSLVEFRRRLDGVDVSAQPVAGEISFGPLAVEYSKYLVSLVEARFFD